MHNKHGEITLRKAEERDCDDIHKWRNDETTRRNSFNSDFITYEEHKEWFDKSLKNSNRYIHIAEDKKGNKVGVVRLDKRNEHVVECSINVAPDMRRKCFGSRMILKACDEFLSKAKPFAEGLFVARIKKENTASIKVFKRADFIEVLNYEGLKTGSVVVLAKTVSGQNENG